LRAWVIKGRGWEAEARHACLRHSLHQTVARGWTLGGARVLIGGGRVGCGPLPLLGMISSALVCRLHSGCTPYVDDRADRCLRLKMVDERAPRRSMTIGRTCSKRHVSRARTDDTSDLPTSPSPGKGANRMLRHACCSPRAPSHGRRHLDRVEFATIAGNGYNRGESGQPPLPTV